jgi:hypothetical protein
MNEIIGIKILDDYNKYSLWVIDEEFDNYYKISLYKDRSRITTINKSKVYINDNDPHFLYSDNTISIKTVVPFAFSNFKTIVFD